jgi:23S rRNA pseudouridine2605 synthase
MADPEIPADSMRLNRFLAQSGLGARRKCDELIEGGHVFVNGEKVTALGTKVLPTDKVEYHGRMIKPVRRLEYCAYHKPAGVMVTRDDPEGRLTVFAALKNAGFDRDHLNYIGRLDYVSEGLLLLTNDGNLIHALTHPRYHIKKVYRVLLDRLLTQEDAEKLVEGVEDKGQVLKAGDIREIIAEEGPWYEVDLYDGKNRQLRRMFDSLSYKVMRLQRIQFAAVKLGSLAPGAIRSLTPGETAALLAAGFPKRKF